MSLSACSDTLIIMFDRYYLSATSSKLNNHDTFVNSVTNFFVSARKLSYGMRSSLFEHIQVFFFNQSAYTFVELSYLLGE